MGMTKKDLLAMLGGGDRRSIGEADRVAAMVRANPRLFGKLIGGMRSEDRLVRMRAADAVEKLSRERPELLSRYKRELLGLLWEAKEPELHWHVAAIVPRLQLTPGERRRAFEGLEGYLDSKSSIVKTFALQALAELAERDARLRVEATEILRVALRSGTAAMKARSRKLILALAKTTPKIP